MQIILYVCRPLNGKHNNNILCELCASNERSEWAVKAKDLFYRIRCRSARSAITSAAMLSTIGTARGTTQGSWRPLASRVIALYIDARHPPTERWPLRPEKLASRVSATTTATSVSAGSVGWLVVAQPANRKSSAMNVVLRCKVSLNLMIFRPLSAS